MGEDSWKGEEELDDISNSISTKDSLFHIEWIENKSENNNDLKFELDLSANKYLRKIEVWLDKLFVKISKFSFKLELY